MIAAAFSKIAGLVPGWIWALIVATLGGINVATCTQRDFARADAKDVKAQWKLEKAALQSALADERERQALVVTKTVIEYRDRVKVVQTQGQEVVREIEKLIPSNSMDSPLLSGAYRVLHDAAAGVGPIPDDPAGAAAAAEPVEGAALIRTTAENYQTCRENALTLESLQAIVKEMSRDRLP